MLQKKREDTKLKQVQWGERYRSRCIKWEETENIFSKQLKNCTSATELHNFLTEILLNKNESIKSNNKRVQM